MSTQHSAVVDSENKSRGSQIITKPESRPTEINSESWNLFSSTDVSHPFLDEDSAPCFEVLSPTIPCYSIPPKPQPQSIKLSNWQEDGLLEPMPPMTPPILEDSPARQHNNMNQVPNFRSQYTGKMSSLLKVTPALLSSRNQQLKSSTCGSYIHNDRSKSSSQESIQQRGNKWNNEPRFSRSPSAPIAVAIRSLPEKQNRSVYVKRSKTNPDMRYQQSPENFQDLRIASWINSSREDMTKSWEVNQIMQNSSQGRRILTIIAPFLEGTNEFSPTKARIKIKRLGTKFPLVTKNLEASKISKINKCPDGRRLVIFFSTNTKRDRKVLDLQFSSSQQQQDCFEFLQQLNSYFQIEKKALRPPPQWDSDDKVTQCPICGSKFNVLINRKHHCRMCGKCVCSNCSRTEAVLPEYGFEKPVRVDVKCYEAILRKKLGSCMGGLGMKRRTSVPADKRTGDLWPKNLLDFDILNPSNVQTQNYAVRNQKQNAKYSAWKKYLAQNHTLNKDSKQLQKIILNGIPSEYRGHVWKNISGCIKKRHEYPEDYYFQLLDYAKRHQNNLPFVSELEKDLHRPMRRDLSTIYKNEEAKAMLKRVLIAYGIRNKKVEYCQSMNFIVAILLLFTKEQDAFWLFCYIIEDICCVDKQFFYHSKELEGWIIDQCVFTVMVEKMLPDLSGHLADLHIPTSALADNWFLCLFVNTLPLGTTFRIWDLMFFDGIDPIFRSALAILMINKERALKAHDLESLLQTIKDIGWSNANTEAFRSGDDDDAESDAFIKVCYSPKISTTLKQLHSLRVFHRAHIEQFARINQAQKSNIVISLDSKPSLPQMSSLAPLAYVAKTGSLDKLFITQKSGALHEVSSLHDLPENNTKLNEKEKVKLARMDGRMIYMDPAYRSKFQEFSQYFGRIETNTNRVEEYFGADTPSNRQCQESPILFPESEASFFKEGLNSSPLPRNSSFSSLCSSNKDSPFSLIEFKGCVPANLVL